MKNGNISTKPLSLLKKAMRSEYAEMEIIRRIYTTVPAETVVAAEQPMDSQLGCKNLC